MIQTLSAAATANVARLAASEGLSLVLLFGSRARGTATATSDSDIGILASTALDPDRYRRLFGQISLASRLPNVDLVDLIRAPALLRFEAARSGVVLYARTPEFFAEYRVRAWKQMLDDEIDFGRLHRQVVADALDRWRA